jgi:hypothetical protein
MAKNQSKASKGETVKAASGKALPLTVETLLNCDPDVLRQALAQQSETKRAEIQSKIDVLRSEFEEKAAPLYEALRSLGYGYSPRRTGNGNGQPQAPKGENAKAFLTVLKGGPLTVKAMEQTEGIKRVMEGKFARSFSAVNLAGLRDKGLVEQTGNRGEWRLTEAGRKEAEALTPPAAAAAAA